MMREAGSKRGRRPGGRTVREAERAAWRLADPGPHEALST